MNFYRNVAVMTFSILSIFAQATDQTNSVHGFSAKDTSGKDVALKDYEGKVLLIVNTASRCGFTRQYKDLVKLKSDYTGKDFEILAFPANNFRNQEPGTNAEIKEFCDAKFNINFPLMAKVSVRGDDQNPLFRYLTTANNEDFTGDIKWNFEKILVGKDGTVLRRYRSMTGPNSKKVRKAIDAALTQ